MGDVAAYRCFYAFYYWQALFQCLFCMPTTSSPLMLRMPGNFIKKKFNKIEFDDVENEGGRWFWWIFLPNFIFIFPFLVFFIYIEFQCRLMRASRRRHRKTMRTMK